ncbi:SMP-30/gluconolactonase/LRE family protein [Hymenobacter metallicola]|uniref:SMP-30/Gluconolactonase/LRE-like region domain-containing protein n=1 Tax=Hymenobacter metallicola TaxID=2563114 RepID=A0A4Z0Q8Y0_9BACT|nr:hypothetical protein [Hymenobacter metallicola]TGE26537.1 hypothetical protein E5K02_17245 [Hymenobacter metallicola]
MKKLLPLLFVAVLPARAQSSASVAAGEPPAASLAYDARSKKYFVGQPQQRKIVWIDAKGKVADFWHPTPLPVAGAEWPQQKLPVLGEVTALQADDAHRSLWACASGWGPAGKRTGLWEFDSRSGALRQLAFVTDTVRQHSFQDLAVTAAGVVYAPDVESGGVYRMRTKMPLTEEIEAWLPADTFVRPTHICLAADGSTLYVVHAGGIARIDAATKHITPVELDSKLEVSTITGLYIYKGLLLVQQQTAAPQIVRYRLEAAGARMEPVGVLPLSRPEPTATLGRGVVVGDEFYYTSTPAATGAEVSLQRISLL